MLRDSDCHVLDILYVIEEGERHAVCIQLCNGCMQLAPSFVKNRSNPIIVTGGETVKVGNAKEITTSVIK
jgi:hypothetical protein